MTSKVEKRKQPPGLFLAWGSELGLVRRRNEDALFADPPPGPLAASHGQLLIVADGMGGPPAGDLASRIAVESISRVYYETKLEAGGDPVPLLRQSFEEANSAILWAAAEDAKRFGMGATCTALLLRADRYWLAHVGDSRAYLLREGRLELLSRDHNVLERLRAEGRLIDEEHPPPGALLLTAALGIQERSMADFSHRPRELRQNDRFLLCSDGLSGMLDEATLAKELAARSPQSAARRLIGKALDAGGRDNITLIVAEWREKP